MVITKTEPNARARHIPAVYTYVYTRRYVGIRTLNIYTCDYSKYNTPVERNKKMYCILLALVSIITVTHNHMIRLVKSKIIQTTF